MSTIEKRLQKFYKKPIPNDITFSDIEVLAEYFGCQIITGGNHSKKLSTKHLELLFPYLFMESM